MSLIKKTAMSALLSHLFSTPMRHMSKLSLCLFTTCFSQLSYGEDEVFLAQLSNNKVISVKNISERVGYDNQPHFTPDSSAVLFSAMFNESRVVEDNSSVKIKEQKMQTDTMHYDIKTAKLQNITQSHASEYSPTITPDGKHFSMIRVGEDAKQRLWQYPFMLKQSNLEAKGTSLAPDVYDVGYHVWINKHELLLFMLGESMTLQRVNLTTGKLSLVDNHIGRTLRKVPKKELFSYTKQVKDRWLVKLYNPQSKGVKNSVLLPGENMYYAWHQDGRLLSAEKAVVQSINASVFGDKWQTYLDFSNECKGDVTRMVMSDDSQYFAFVCHTPDKK